MPDKIETKPHSTRSFQYLVGVLNLKLSSEPVSSIHPGYTAIRKTCAGDSDIICHAEVQKGNFSAGGILDFANEQTTALVAQWILNDMDMPRYKVVQRTIDDLLEQLDEICIQIRNLCGQLCLIGGTRIYIDGTKIKENASKHHAVSYGYLNKNRKECGEN